MADTILFIVEGESAEPKILDSLWQTYFRDSGSQKYHVTYDSNIYLLWNEMKDDPNLELIEILMERSDRNREELEPIKGKIARVFLFFDYDGHAVEAKGNDLALMLDYFSDETDDSRGKLFVSYPMVESLRHFNPSAYSFQTVAAEIDECSSYKERVGSESHAKYQDISKYTGSIWDELAVANLCKGFDLVTGEFALPQNVESVDQQVLFQNQMEKHIIPHEEVAVLSGFPFFLFHYFGESILNRLRKQV